MNRHCPSCEMVLANRAAACRFCDYPLDDSFWRAFEETTADPAPVPEEPSEPVSAPMAVGDPFADQAFSTGSMEAVSASLRALEEQSKVSALMKPPPRRQRQPLGRRAGLLVVLVLIAGLSLLVHRMSGSTMATSHARKCQSDCQMEYDALEGVGVEGLNHMDYMSACASECLRPPAARPVSTTAARPP